MVSTFDPSVKTKPCVEPLVYLPISGVSARKGPGADPDRLYRQAAGTHLRGLAKAVPLPAQNHTSPKRKRGT